MTERAEKPTRLWVDPVKGRVGDVASIFTCMRFGNALMAVQSELRHHEREKGSTWQNFPVRYHARHAAVHFILALLWMPTGRVRSITGHLAHGCCRALFAFERWSETHQGRCCTPPPAVSHEPITRTDGSRN